MPISTNVSNNFSSLNMQDLVDTMSLIRLKTTKNQLPKLDLTPIQQKNINTTIPNLIQKIENQIDYLNESELTVKYIFKIMDLVGFESENYSTFLERSLSGTVKGFQFSGTVDMMIASGFYEPKQPYFFIQEFKKAKNPSGDPLPQLLGEMLVAQQNNSNTDLIYGVYIVGRLWYFVSLDKLNYKEYSPLDSVDSVDLKEIILHLNWVKNNIEKQIKEKNTTINSK